MRPASTSRMTAVPSSSEASRSTSASKPQSWSPAGSSRICRTRHTPGWPVDDQQRRARGRRRRCPPRRARRSTRRTTSSQRSAVQPGVGVQHAEVVPAAPGEQLHPPEQRIADHRGERPLVAGQRARPGRHRHRRVQRLVRAGELLPLVEQRRIDLAHKLAEPLDDVGDLLGARGGGHPGPQRLERVGQVAQHRALGAGQPVDADELPEGERPLPHLADDGLRRQLRRRRPTGCSAGTPRRRARAAPRAASG